MEYLVTGATGHMGTHLVRQLVDDGHDVVALTRSRPNAGHLPAETTVAEGDVTAKESLREPMDGVDGVFHLAAWVPVGPGPWNVETAERVNVDGTRTVLELVSELDVPRAVYTSGLGVFPGESEQPYDETQRPDCPTAAVHFRTLWEAHYEVARPMIADGLPLVVVLPGALYGPVERPPQGGTPRAAFRDYLTGDLPVIPRGFTIPWEHAEDTGRNLVRAMADGEPGEEYVIAADEARSMVEVFALAEEITGVPAPRAVPPWVFAGAAKVMAAVETVTRPPPGLESELLAWFAGRDYSAENRKARRELGIEHRPFEEGFREYLHWEMAQLGMSPPDERPTAP